MGHNSIHRTPFGHGEGAISINPLSLRDEPIQYFEVFGLAWSVELTDFSKMPSILKAGVSSIRPRRISF